MKPEDIKKDQADLQESTPQIAFKDFKKAISVEEFEAILEVAKHEYKVMKNVIASRERFLSQSEEKLEGPGIEDIPIELKKKLIAGFNRKIEKDLFAKFEGEFKRIDHITEFINRFSATDDQVEKLDVEFAKKIIG